MTEEVAQIKDLIVGEYLATPLEWKVRESQKTESVGIRIIWSVQSLIKDNQLVPCTVQAVEGTVWLRRKDGHINASGMTTMAEVLGWKGEMAHFEDKEKFFPQGTYRITLEYDDYNKGLRVAFVNPSDGSRPQPKVTKSRLEQLDIEMADEIQAWMRGEKIHAASPKEQQRDQANPPPTGDQIPF